MPEEELVVKLTREQYATLRLAWRKEIDTARREGDEKRAEILEAIGIEGYVNVLISRATKMGIELIG
ncbi:MAG: hypothetical protein ACE5QW_04380 [Thermoplasmata archaeon]